MMKEFKNITVIVDDRQIKARLRSYCRQGSESPALILIFIDGRWATPFEQKLKKIYISLVGLLKITYYNAPSGYLTYEKNTFLQLICNDATPSAVYTPLPYLDLKKE